MTVIPEADPRIIKPLLRVSRLEGAPHRHETSLKEMLGLFTGQMPIAPRHAISSHSAKFARGVKIATDFHGTLADVVAVSVADGGGAVP
jgi:hypothetical protein